MEVHWEEQTFHFATKMRSKSIKIEAKLLEHGGLGGPWGAPKAHSDTLGSKEDPGGFQRHLPTGMALKFFREQILIFVQLEL